MTWAQAMTCDFILDESGKIINIKRSILKIKAPDLCFGPDRTVDTPYTVDPDISDLYYW